MNNFIRSGFIALLGAVLLFTPTVQAANGIVSHQIKDAVRLIMLGDCGHLMGFILVFKDNDLGTVTYDSEHESSIHQIELLLKKLPKDSVLKVNIEMKGCDDT